MTIRKSQLTTAHQKAVCLKYKENVPMEAIKMPRKYENKRQINNIKQIYVQ